MNLSLDEARFLKDLEDLGRIGAGRGGGVNRPGYSPADLEARAFVEVWMGELGMDVRRDPAGNTVGLYPGERPELPPIALGSHTDSVPDGGRYDGALGVAAAVACVRALQAAGRRLTRSLEVINFTAEEGAMSGITFGSQTMAGSLSSEILDREAYDGRPVREHLREAGLEPDEIFSAVRAPGSLAAYLELHIEQGGVLEAEGIPLGVVEGIVGIRLYTVRFEGEANHAGTTPMAARRDALVMAAPFITAVRDLALRRGIVATVGRVAVEPGAPNVIPGVVQVSAECRDLDEAVLDEAEEELRALALELGASIQLTAREAAVRSDPQFVAALETACADLGLNCLRMQSGAGHDAMAIAAIAPVAMLFVRSQGGVSHSPREYSTLEDCAAGAKALLAAALQLDRTLASGEPHRGQVGLL